jgi:hypothetical protein
MAKTRYLKLCIICQGKFYALKANAIYCSKKCANRTRYLPKKLIASLVRRNTEFTIEVDDLSFIPGATRSNPLGNELAIAQAHAVELARQRGITPPSPGSKQYQDNVDRISTSGFGSHDIDEEMRSMMHELKEDEIPVINSKELEAKLEQEEMAKALHIQQLQPQQGGLRKFGSLKGVKENGSH